jgi:mono/diheme cytochrome c family protein
MRRLLTFPLMLLAGALLCPEETEGGGCAVGHYATATYQAPYVASTVSYAPAVYLAVFQVYQPVPVVFSTYQPVVAVPVAVPNVVAPVTPAKVGVAGQASGATPCEQQLQALTARIAQLEAALKVPAPTRPSQKEDAPPSQPQAQAPASKGLAVMVTACAGCHERQNAAEKGKGLVLLDSGALVDLSDAQLVKVYRSILSGKMPKGTKLTQEEGSSLLEYLDTLKGGVK